MVDNVEIPGFIDNRPMSGRQYSIVALCGLIMFMDGFDTQSIAYVAPFIEETWDLSQESLGALFSSSLFGLMVGYLGIAPLGDRIGPRRMLLLVNLLLAPIIMLSTYAPNETVLIGLRFLTGIGLGALIPSAVSLTSEFSPKTRRASAVLAIYVAYSLGFVVAGLLAGVAIPTFGWGVMFWVGGLFAFVVTPVLFFLLPESIAFSVRKERNLDVVRKTLCRIDPKLPANIVVTLQKRPEGRKADYKTTPPYAELFSSRRLLGTLFIWVILAVNLGVFYALQNWLPTIVEREGLAMGNVVAATTLTTVGGILAAFVMGPAMDRISPYGALGVLYFFGFVFFIVLGFSFMAPLWVLLTVSVLVGFCVSGGQKSAIAMTAVFYPPEIRSTGVAVALGVGRVGAISGPLLIGIFMDPSWEPSAIFSSMAVPMLLLSVFSWLLGRAYSETKRSLVDLKNEKEKRSRPGILIKKNETLWRGVKGEGERIDKKKNRKYGTV